MVRRYRQRGVSLLEALVVCALLAVLATLSAGGMVGLIERRRFEGLAQSITQDFQHARSEAVLRNDNLSVTFGSDASGSCYVFYSGTRGHCSCKSDGSSSCRSDATEFQTVSWPRSDGIWLEEIPIPATISGRLGTLSPGVTVGLVNASGEGRDVVVAPTGRARTCWQRKPIAGMRKCDNQRGFTLIEMMVALVVAAVLAAIALPTYQSVIRKARRSDAIAEVARIQQAQEHFRASRASYSAELGSSADGLRITPATGAVSSYDSPGGHYAISVADASATGYTVTARARPASSQSDDAPCQCLRLSWSNATGRYSAASMDEGGCGAFGAADAKACWRR